MATLFCPKCAPLTSGLTYDPAAGSFAEMMSGALIWGDERGKWCIPCVWAMRAIFRLRYCMTVGEPLDPESLETWRKLEQEFPNWPLFRPDRRRPEDGPQVRDLVEGKTNRFIEEFDEFLERTDPEKGP
jgi:hypothetical protein